ncbi:hypothetical protein L6452_20691 [Arctium lappa]|uniref:Uncharacterized protein n=1 Tax=Arctium lappa TaxID=4217 RepID=A0ACB9BDE4_ARCLA|nr:hypothetical protein L6452_20691 [Arctium lappa]
MTQKVYVYSQGPRTRNVRLDMVLIIRDTWRRRRLLKSPPVSLLASPSFRDEPKFIIIHCPITNPSFLYLFNLKLQKSTPFVFFLYSGQGKLFYSTIQALALIYKPYSHVFTSNLEARFHVNLTWSNGDVTILMFDYMEIGFTTDCD